MAATDSKSRSAVKQQLRDAIDVSIDSANTHGPNRLVVWLSYRDTERERSLKVAQILLDSLVKGTLGGSMENSGNAHEFLVARIQE